MEPALSSTKHFRNEVIRKSLHLPAFLIPTLAFCSQGLAAGLLIVLVVVYGLVLFLKDKQEFSVPFLLPLIQFCKRRLRYDMAPVYLALGMLVAVLVSPPEDVFFAAYVIAICDSGAAIVGIRLGRHRIFYRKKTYEGSLTFFVLCFLGGLFFFSPLYALFAAFILAFAEMVSTRGLDNFTLPVLSQLLLLYF